MSLSLAQLRDALTALGISTSTGELRGDARRAELQHRLLAAQKARRENRDDASDQQNDGDAITIIAPPSRDPMQAFQAMTLSELRKALDDRGLSTHTPGLKGESRRYALVQRLLNGSSHSRSEPNDPATPHDRWMDSSKMETASLASSRSGVGSEAYSSAGTVSTVGDFLFFDPSTKENPPTPHKTLNTNIEIPALRISPRLPAKRSVSSILQVDQRRSQAEPKVDKSDRPDVEADADDKIFQIRHELHTLRVRRNERREQALHDAGIHVTLDAVSNEIALLERERQRLLHSHFSHELVTLRLPRLEALVSSSPRALELIQEDAVQLLTKLQEQLKQQAANLKQALFIVADQDTDEHAEDQIEEERLLSLLREWLVHRSRDPHISSGTIATARPSHPTNQSRNGDSGGAPILTRCRSVPNGHQMFYQTWKELDADGKCQMHDELRSAKSSRIQQHRVRLPGTIVRTNSSGNNNGSNSTTSAADRLGMKALYLQRSQRSMALTHQAFQDALLLNANHAVNLGNYALFLYLDCGRHDQAQQFFERAIRADAHNTTNLAHYANFLKCVRGDIGRAEVLYLQALHLAPHDPDLIGNYAGLLAKTPDGKGKAKQLLREGLQKAPGHRRNILRLASLLSEQGQFEAAEAWLKQLLALLEADDPQHQSATTLTQSTVKWHLELAHVYGNYANLLRKQPQRWEDAKKMYGMAMQFNPTHPLLQRNFSLFLRDWKNHTKPKLSSV